MVKKELGVLDRLKEKSYICLRFRVSGAQIIKRE